MFYFWLKVSVSSLLSVYHLCGHVSAVCDVKGEIPQPAINSYISYSCSLIAGGCFSPFTLNVFCFKIVIYNKDIWKHKNPLIWCFGDYSVAVVVNDSLLYKTPGRVSQCSIWAKVLSEHLHRCYYIVYWQVSSNNMAFATCSVSVLAL